MADERKIAWFVACEESAMPKGLVHVQTKEGADESIPPQVIIAATLEFDMATMEPEEEATVTITRTFMTDAEIEALPDL
ncbi:hypothetical protein LCGC14_1746880 [marine sediment metagenome]|uniref:Uncharacterized protein n=1 Tax=marine sediment metagenome TaxID=412755 RepID=A0A0F9HSD6_9ZZZZ